MARKDQMTLGAFFHPTGHHVAAWLHPGAQIDAGSNIEHYLELARISERGKFHFMFLADAAAVRSGKPQALRRWPQYMAYFEPITLLSAIASCTSRLGLVATATTSYNEPYHVARKFASLDHISHGRAGWNVVTSGVQAEAYNFGRDEHYEHDARYMRAHEFVQVVKGLWDSWDDDAFVRDRSTAIYYDPEKLHVLRHKGEHYSVLGPLNIARPPQGHPVIVQAGASEVGRDFAAEFAEVVFSATSQSFQVAKSFYDDVKGRMAKFCRKPEQLRITVGWNAIVGRTNEEAEEKHQYLQSLIHPDVGLELLSDALGGFDLTKYPLDGPLPDVPTETKSNKGHLMKVVSWARDENLTIRQLYQRYAGARGNRTVMGSAQQVADEMEQWFQGGAADGFLVQPAYLPDGLTDFVDLVIPELQRRGLFHKDYAGTTLRENLGLRRPASRYASTGEAASK